MSLQGGFSVKLHITLNLDQGHASQEGELLSVRACERDRGADISLQSMAASFCMEEPLSVFMLIQWDSCGHLEPASAYVSPRLSKPAPFIILQQPCSNWAASPPAVTHHLLHTEPRRYRCSWSGTAPVAAHQNPHLNCICGQLSPSIHTELIPGMSLLFLPVGTCLPFSSQWCGSLVMMWPITLTRDEATPLQGLEASPNMATH